MSLEEGKEREGKGIVYLIPYRQLQRRINIPLLLVPPHMHQMLPHALIGHAMHQPRVRVEVENNGFVGGEERGVLLRAETVGVVAIRHQPEQIHHIHKPDL